MRLIDAAMELCVFVNTRREQDGLGGYYTSYEDGAEFKAAITHNSTLQAMIAEKQGYKATYTITTPEGVGLQPGNLIRRKDDGQVFRITSNSRDEKTPRSASFKYEQTTAEATELE